MTNAYLAVRNSGMSVHKASKVHGVPLTSLRDRVDGRVSVDATKSGPEPLFSQGEEAKLVNHITSMSELGYGYTRAQVLELATDFAVDLGKREKSKPLSMYWFYNFLGRWPELHVVKPRGLSTCRARAASSEVIDKYFLELEKILIKYSLKDRRQSIYNVDEKGISTEHRPPNVVAGRGTPAQAITSPRSSTTTILGCGNALGQQLPPYFVFAGKRMRQELLEGCLPGTGATVTDSGWSNSAVFLQYLQEHFSNYVHATREDPVLLLYDGHASHVSLPVVDWAREHNIILFVFPPHCSHILQPMDVGCFGPLETIYSRECLSYLRNNPGQTVTRLNVCSLASKAYSCALSPENLRSAFREAGVHPLNPGVVPKSKLLPATVFDKPAKSDMQVSQPDPSCETNKPDDTVLNATEKPDAFFESRGISAKQVASRKSVVRKTVHPIVSGKAITEDSVTEQLKSYNATKATGKSKTNKRPGCGTSDKTPKKKMQKRADTVPCSSKKQTPPHPRVISDSPQPGPSAYYVEDSESQQDSLDDGDDQSENCCVCHKFSPEALRHCIALVIVKWAQCDVCGHWTHLKFCSPVSVIRRHSRFLCPHCVEQD